MRSWLERVLSGPRWRLALEAWAIVVVAAALWQIVGKLHVYQWDVIVYWWGGRAFAHGQSPYGTIPGQPEYLHFVYPPIVAALFAPLAILKPSVAKLLWITLKAFAFWITVRLWRRAVGTEQHAVPPVFFFTFAFGSAALVDFTAGNIAVFEQLVLWLAFAALLARRRWTFALLVVLAAQCKLTPVFFLGLLLVVDERPHWGPFLGGGALMAALVGANVVLFPGQTREFLASVSALAERGWGDPSTLGVMQDLVDQLRGLRLPLPDATAYALYLAAAAFILAQTVRWWRAQRLAGTTRPVEIVLVTLVTYALVMPRMKDYSYVALLPVAWYALSGRQAVTASLAVLAVLVPRPLPQLKLWLPLVPQPYTYAPLLAALVLWTMLTNVEREQAVAARGSDEDSDELSTKTAAISAA
ncbi:MAG TPA: glycosyltransferase family 87 protein [Gemmatimonadaceae bacterium]